MNFPNPFEPLPPERYADAFVAGYRWASGLKPGDYFNGAANEAERRYINRFEEFAFTDGACSYFYDELAPVFKVDKRERKVLINESRC